MSDVPARPIRTALLVAANDADAVSLARASAADALYLDLEAAVPVDELAEARQRAGDVIDHDDDHAVVVRVNPERTGLLAADLDAVVRPGLYGVMLAKIADPAEVRALDDALARRERDAGIAPGTIVIHPVVETAPAVRHAYEIARASPRVAHMGGITAPGGDLARAIGFRWSADGATTEHLRARILVDVRAAGVPFPMSGLAPREDVDEAVAIASEARRLGYEGMLLVHPNHAPAVNTVFTPRRSERERWQAIVAAGARGETSFNGRRLDADLVAWARARLAAAEWFESP